MSERLATIKKVAVLGSMPGMLSEEFARESIEWLWAQRNDQGLWDLGPRSPASVYLPLSDSWRRRQDRVYDWATRVLILLGRAHRQGYLPGCDVPLLRPSRRCG